ncbi:MAG: tRNA lysidine(34) synthetase TilS [Betaproteobacteria bacterium]|nr:tRNA lysidine(34) synthetase TilS [Betaproteobacteria bacterium]
MSGSSPTAVLLTRASAERSSPAVAVACSGGPDSMAALWLVWRSASAMGVQTWAFHVHHGLQVSADQWPGFIAEELARWSSWHPKWSPVQLRVCHLLEKPGRGRSVQAWAREARYKALKAMAQEQGIDLMVLAHHRQDQAETFLLQALRGAGPQGLAGMPRLAWRDGVCWARPFLDHSRSDLQQVLAQAGINSVADPSNQDPQWARSGLRLSVWSALVDAFAGAESALARAARRCAQALETLDQGVQADRARCVIEQGQGGFRWSMDQPAWEALSPARRSQLLRAWFVQCGLAVPASVVDRLSVYPWARASAKRWPLDALHELRWYRGVIQIDRKPVSAAKAVADVSLRWSRAGTKQAPGWAGRISLRRAPPDQMGAALHLPCTLLVRTRRGDDQFQLSPRGTPRALKKQFQSRAVAAWDRSGPVVAAQDGALLWVPGLGWDARVLQIPGGWQLHWHPDDPLPEEAADLAAAPPRMQGFA